MFLDVALTTTATATEHNSCAYCRTNSVSLAKASNARIYHRLIPSRSSSIASTPPQRQRGCIHWTPQCSSGNSPTNQTPHSPSQAITPSRPPLTSDHLQTADQSTYPLPIPLHITNVACCYTLHFTRFLSVGIAATLSCAIAALDRHCTLDESNKRRPPLRFPYFSYIIPVPLLAAARYDA
jgi:hypothetical protein